ncbi:hypothetical protein [Flavobacterium sp.]|uniref:hypothetical protein n=1 Tax=Flavobacterium sp. TaxID=239 RepID=UPI002FD9B5EF
MKRIVIYPKDVVLLFGKTERQARYLLSNIKAFYKKEKHQFITVVEFCLYMGLAIEEVSPLLK